MNNFPVQSSADIFSSGLFGSSGSLFDGSLTYITDVPLLPVAQQNAMYYSTDIRDNFTSVVTTNGYDTSSSCVFDPISVVDSCTTDVTVSTYNNTETETIAVADTAVGFENVSSDAQTVGSADDQTGDCESSVAEDSGTTDASSAVKPSDESVGSEVLIIKCEKEIALAADDCDPVVAAAAADDPVVDISINNVVCAFSTKCYLNLKKIASFAMNVEYKRATGMVSMKLRKPSVTASIWASGKVTCTGSRSEEEAREAARRIARCLSKICTSVKFTEFRVVNVLGTCSLPFGIRINEFSRKYPKQVSYEPELHPGVTYKLITPKATLKIFSTGSITVTAPRIVNIQRAIEHIYPLVIEFQMDKVRDNNVETETSSFPQHQQQQHCYLMSCKSVKRPNEGEPFNQKQKRMRDGNEENGDWFNEDDDTGL